MIPGVDPKVDFAFKKVFGSESNIPLLIDLLHAVLNPPPEERIASVEILNPFNEKDASAGKLSVLAIKVRDARGHLYNVEMQMAGSLTFPQRMLYYWALMYGRQLREAEDFEALRATISIVFVNDVLFPEVADYHLDFQLRSARHPALIFCDHQAIHLLELPKFHRPAEDLPGPLDVWCYFLVHGAELDRDKLPAALCVPPLQKAMEVLEMLTKNDVEWLEYQARRIAEMDQISRLKSARLVGHQEGRQEGRQEGLQEGVEKGELIGRIHVCQRMLRTLVTPNIELTALAVPELRAMAEGLEKQAGVAEN